MPAPDYATEIAALEAGLASGEASIRGPDGRETKYRTPPEILQALSYFRGLRDQQQGTGGSTTTFATFRRD